ncbi:MAG: hypothetical protein PUE58_01960 [Lachnospiraceae bacterium]|nr:hypothetical protein [Lachnospiraceae bacterium]
MTIIEIKPEYVFSTLQKLGSGEKLLCADFKKSELTDTYGLVAGELSRRLQLPECKFFKVTMTEA